jgi:hypothetical protein
METRLPYIIVKSQGARIVLDEQNVLAGNQTRDQGVRIRLQRADVDRLLGHAAGQEPQARGCRRAARLGAELEAPSPTALPGLAVTAAPASA